jgi:hypothetical protein
MAKLLHVRDASEEEGSSHVPAKRPFPTGYASLITFPKDAGVLAHNPLARTNVKDEEKEIKIKEIFMTG